MSRQNNNVPEQCTLMPCRVITCSCGFSSVIPQEPRQEELNLVENKIKFIQTHFMLQGHRKVSEIVENYYVCYGDKFQTKNIREMEQHISKCHNTESYRTFFEPIKGVSIKCSVCCEGDRRIYVPNGVNIPEFLKSHKNGFCSRKNFTFQIIETNVPLYKPKKDMVDSDLFEEGCFPVSQFNGYAGHLCGKRCGVSTN